MDLTRDRLLFTNLSSLLQSQLKQADHFRLHEQVDFLDHLRQIAPTLEKSFHVNEHVQSTRTAIHLTLSKNCLKAYFKHK